MEIIDEGIRGEGGLQTLKFSEDRGQGVGSR